MNVCLVNDSFHPLIDGVVNVVENYAEIINHGLGKASVVTPYLPNTEDEKFDYEIMRYPSSALTEKSTGYRAGIPFSSELMDKIAAKNFDVIHCHCPISSMFLSRAIRDRISKPLILTYHTKFDIDIANAVKGKLIQKEAIALMAKNISACDEAWCVSKGAGKNLESIGYKGKWIVMPNGVDFPKGRVSDELCRKVSEGIDLPDGVPVFLFVGRMMWYKGIKIILDGLKKLDNEGIDYRMVFVGKGTDKDDIVSYADKLNFGGKVFFAEPIYDRELLRAWYCRADMFLFPSTFDTNGLVVREAAACGLGSVLIKDSCAAEDVTDGVSGLLIEENADSMAECLKKICAAPEICKKIGRGAEDNLYMSWQDSVENAVDRYYAVCDNYKRGFYAKKKPLVPRDIYNIAAKMTDTGFGLTQMLSESISEFKSDMGEVKKHL